VSDAKIERLDIPTNTAKLLKEILAQNFFIIQMNDNIIKSLISAPVLYNTEKPSDG
jgi:hypothetical protein